MSYLEQINENFIQLNKFIKNTQNCIKKINLKEYPKTKILDFINNHNIDFYNDIINDLFNKFNRIPVINNDYNKNCNLKILNCLDKTISFFLYFISMYNTEKLDESNLLCKSIINNILENFLNIVEEGKENFIFLIKNVKFYFAEQNNNLKELKQVCQFFDTINELFEQNSLLSEEPNFKKFLVFREKFNKIRQLIEDKKSKIEQTKNKSKNFKRDESKIETRLKELNYQLEQDLHFKKSKSADVVYKNPIYSLFNNDIDNEAMIKDSLENLDLANYTEPPALPIDEEELFQKELKCIEDFNKKLLKKHKSLEDIK